MDSWVHSALKSILRGDPIFESAAEFFIIILKFISTSIFEIKIHEKKFRDTKKILFTKVDFYKAWDSYSSRSQCHTRKSNLVDRNLALVLCRASSIRTIVTLFSLSEIVWRKRQNLLQGQLNVLSLFYWNLLWHLELKFMKKFLDAKIISKADFRKSTYTCYNLLYN